MKQIIILSLFMLLISLSFQQYIGFRHPRSKNRFKYIDSRRIRRHPRFMKTHRTILSYENDKNDLTKTNLNDNKATKYNRGPDGQYLHYGRNRINSPKK